MYTELDLMFLGFKMPNVGVLITEDLNQVLDKEHQTKLPGIVGWNLIWLSYNTFIKEHRTIGFDSFECPEGANPLLFAYTSEVMSQQVEQSKILKKYDLYKNDQ